MCGARGARLTDRLSAIGYQYFGRPGGCPQSGRARRALGHLVVRRATASAAHHTSGPESRYLSY
jgi:hypothetical protein